MIDAARDDPIAAPFWRAAESGRLSLPWCGDCNRAVWYPEAACPRCGQALDWRTLDGNGTLFSWTVVRKPLSPFFELPYVPALVVPDEAPHVHLVTQLVDCDPAGLRCGQPVRAVFRELRPRTGAPFTAPLFIPEAD